MCRVAHKPQPQFVLPFVHQLELDQPGTSDERGLQYNGRVRKEREVGIGFLRLVLVVGFVRLGHGITSRCRVSGGVTDTRLLHPAFFILVKQA